MRFVLGAFKWIAIALVIVALVLLILPWSAAKIDSVGAQKRAAYLNSQTVYRGNPDGSGNLTFLPEFYNHKLYLFGEIHGFAPPQEFDLALARDLNQRAGVRWQIAEIDPAQALAFNYFLETGDHALAREVFDNWASKNMQWASQEFFEKLQNLRQYNQSLEPENRYHFIGVDRPHEEKFVEKISGLTAQIGQSSMMTDKGRLAHSVNVSLLMQTLARDTSASRYEHIIPNIEMVLAADNFANEKFYGFWGIFHVLETPVNETAKPLAMRLSESPMLRGNIVSMASFYGPGSYNMMPASAMPGPLQGPDDEEYILLPMGNDNPWLSYTKGVRDFQIAANGDPVMVVNMDGPNSPYETGGRVVNSFGLMRMLQRFEIEGSVSEAVDYVVYFEDARALTPWSGRAYDVSGKAFE